MATTLNSTGIETSSDLSSLPEGGAQPSGIPFQPYIDAAYVSESEDRQKQLTAWKSDATRQLDSLILDWDGASKGKDFDLGYDPDPERAKKRGIVSSYLSIQNDGQPIPGGELGPGMLRDRIANQRFGGRGVGSDEAFYAEIAKESQTRKSTKELFDGITEASTLAAITGTVESPDKATTFEQWLEKSKASGSFKPGSEFSYREAWESVREQSLENMDRFGPQLQQVWQAFKAGGAGTPSELGKALLLDVFTRPMGTGSEGLSSALGEEIGKKDAFATAAEVYATLNPEDRAPFMDALGQMADSLSKEERATFFGNLALQSGRGIDRLLQNIGSVPSSGSDLRGLGDFVSGAGPTGSELRRDLDIPGMLEARNFASDVRRIEQGRYNPIKSAFHEGSPGWLEGGIYQIPEALASTAVALTPYVGQIAIYSSVQGTAYDTVRNNLRPSMGDEKASAMAAEWAPIIAAPTMAIERLQASALLGRFPLLEGTLNKITDQIRNTALRAGTRMAAGAVEQTASEMVQDYLPSVAQEMASAMEQEIPDVKWRGQGGVFDGFWTQFATTMVSMSPLAVGSGIGGISAEGRARAFQAATDNQLRAFGVNQAGIDSIRSAQGQSSLNAAVDQALANRDPNSEVAKAAVEAEDAEIRKQLETAQLSSDSGAFPMIVQSPDGFIVSDKNTGATYGPVATSGEAVALAQANFTAAQRINAEQVSYLSSMLDSVSAASDGKTTTELDLSTVMTPLMAQNLAPGASNRIKDQLSLIEKAQGLTEDFAGQVFGMSQTDFEMGQRQTINRLFSGSSVATVFHEQWHGQYAEALATGRISRDEALEFAMTMDALFKQAKNKRQLHLNLFPEGITADRVTDTMLDEAISQIAEAEVLRSRKGGSDREGEGRQNVQKIQSGFVTRNIKSLAGKGMRSAKKFSSLFDAVRQYFGVAMGRALVIRQADRNRKFDRAKYDQMISRITGLTDQDAVATEAAKVGKEIVGDSTMTSDPSFSVGPEIIDPLISNAVDRVSDPKQKASMMNRLVDKLNQLKLFAATGEPLFGDRSLTQEEFSRQMVNLENERISIREEFDSRMESINDIPGANLQAEQARARRDRDNALARVDFKEERLSSRMALADQKQTTIDGLAIFDGILSVLPTDLRGKVGGYTKLASLTTPEAQRKYLEGRIEKASGIIDDYLKKEYGRLFDKLLERAKPIKGKPGERPSGKAGADVHSLFDTIREAMTWDDAQLQSHLAGIDAELNDPNNPTDAAREAHLTLEAGLLPLVSDWKNADAARRAGALESATSVFEAGYAKFKLAKLLEKEDRDIRKAALEADTGLSGTREERDQRFEEDNKIKGRLKDFTLSLGSFEQILDYVFGRDSKEAIRIADLEREASNQKEDNIQGKMDGVDNLFTSIAGSEYQGTVARYNLSQKSMTVGGQRLSEMEAIAATMMWMQQDGKRHMEGRKDGDGNFIHKGVGNDGKNWHYDQSFIDEIESKLSDEAKAVRAFLMDQYAKEYDEINPTFRDLYGIDLPKNALYSPITVKQQLQKGQMADPVTGQLQSGTSNTPGSLRTRGSSISEPNFRDALQTYIAHTKQMAHWQAYAPFMKEVSFLRNRELGNAVEAKAGEEGLSVMRDWLNFFEAGGTRDASAHLEMNQTMNRMAGRAASAALVGRMSVLAIQATQLGAAMAEMPMGAFLKRFGKLITGQLGWGKAINSEYIQRRKAEMPVVVRHAMDALAASKPNQLKHQVQRMGRLIGGADALFTAGTYAMVYDYQLSQAKQNGMSQAEAEAFATKAAERVTDRVAQPTRAATRSLFENTAGGPALRILWSFASDARQKLALALWRAVDPKRSLGEKARAVALTWVVNGMIASMIRAVLKDIRTDDDEETDEKIYSPRALILSSLTGPLQGVPFLGGEIESAIYGASGEYLPGGNLLGGLPQSFKAATRVTDWGDAKPDEVMRDIDQMLSGLALFNDTISAASSVSHLIRDAYGIVENAVD